MNKAKETPEERDARKKREMEEMVARFAQSRAPNDMALEAELRRQSAVPLSAEDLEPQDKSVVGHPPPVTGTLQIVEHDEGEGNAAPEEEVKSPVAPRTARAGKLDEPLKPRRFPTATVASPANEVLFKEFGVQIRAFKISDPARRITVAVTEEVFSRVSHLGFVERLGKLEILSFLLERFVPGDRPEKLVRWLAREPEDENRLRHLTFFEDSDLADRLAWLKNRHGITKVTVVENIVLQVLPAAPFHVPPTKRKRAGLAS
jgi:hypothetical protein